MNPSEIKKQVENDLPKGVEITKANVYGIYFKFTDAYGDQTVIVIGEKGEIVTHEQADSFGNKAGTNFSPDVIMFMWRLSRMAQDKPW